jgi:GAF domain-containing protein
MGETDSSPSAREIDVPMSLRDQIIGAISLASDSEWTEDQRSLVEAVVAQTALALANARLVEATQSTAQRERLLAEITGKVWSSPTVDGILRVAAGELGPAMGADLAEIELRLEAGDG